MDLKERVAELEKALVEARNTVDECVRQVKECEGRTVRLESQLSGAQSRIEALRVAAQALVDQWHIEGRSGVGDASHRAALLWCADGLEAALKAVG